MQTLLPYANFSETATVLSDLHLAGQRSQVLAIMEALAGVERRWRHHPAVVMWTGCEFELARYGVTVCREYASRNHADDWERRILEFAEDALVHGVWLPGRNDGTPWWLGNEGFHLSHRSNLVRESPEQYRKYWPDVSDSLEFVWPEMRPPLSREGRRT